LESSIILLVPVVANFNTPVALSALSVCVSPAFVVVDAAIVRCLASEVPFPLPPPSK
jgi:hypothetical protein